MKRAFLFTSLSIVLGSTLFVGCNSSTSGGSVTVERGAVLDATVKDASGQIATMIENSNTYKFANKIVYPVSVTGGFIDVDDSGDKSVGDINLTTELKTYSGSNITLITTAIAAADKSKRDELLNNLATSLGVSSEELLKLPSQSYDSAIVSNEIFKNLLTNSSLSAKDIIENADLYNLKTNFETKKGSIADGEANDKFALNLEQEYINNLIENGKVTPISYEDIKDEVGENAFEMSIFHVNDIHSHITSETMNLKFDDVSTTVDIGGYARLVTKLDDLKTLKPNSLTLNAGDAFQGTLYYSLFKGEADAAAMNLISWDAYTLGNHEFDDGDEGLKSFLDLLDDDIPVISSNVTPNTGNILKDYWEPYVIKTLNDEKIGIIGIDVVGKTKNSSNPSDEIVFTDEVETAQKYIDELTTLGVNKIVLLTHQGYNYDLEMAEKLTGVDVIVGGDSHSLLGDYSQLGLSSQSNDYPTRKKTKDGKKVCIVHAWEYAHALGDLDVMFDKNGDVIACDGSAKLLVGDNFVQNSTTVDSSTKEAILDTIESNKNIEVVVENTEALNVIQTFVDKVDSQKNVVLGTVSERLGHNRIPGDKKDGVEALALGSDIAPIVAKSFYDLSNRADACIQNAGGVRIAIEEGDVTFGDAYTLLPFANTLFEIDMYGSEVKAVLEDAVEEALYGGDDKIISTGSFPYSYGLKYDVDGTQAYGSRISNLEIKDRETGNWSNIISDKMYVIVTNNYTAGGKDGYLTFKSVQDERGVGVDTYLDYALSFVKYVENLTSNNQSLSKLPSIDHPIKSFKNKE